MSDNTKIEWTDATWSPTLGCTRVSEGCDGCYAIRTVHRMAHNPNPKIAAAAAELTERRDGRLDWTGAVRTLPERLTLPLRWKKPRRIFVDSQSDLFHQDVPDEYIAKVFAVMALTPQHTYQLLTKRYGRMRSLLTSNETWRELLYEALSWAVGIDLPISANRFTEAREWVYGSGVRPEVVRPLPNVWLGVSAENQATANLRVPALLETPAAIRFVSAEPLLGPVDLTRLQRRPDATAAIDALSGDVWSTTHGDIYAAAPGCIDWVIVGGESGYGARPMHPGWARSLRDQTTKAGRSFLFKQWGEWGPAGLGIGMAQHNAGREVLVGDPLDEIGHRQVMRRVGKGKAGRELDGRTWDAFPVSLAEHPVQESGVAGVPTTP